MRTQVAIIGTRLMGVVPRKPATQGWSCRATCPRPRHTVGRPDMSGYDRRIQVAGFECTRDSTAAQRVLAKNYVALPLEAA